MIFIFYHDNCPDGFGSAWAFHNKYGDTVNYIPVSFSNIEEKVNFDILKGNTVFILDFHFKINIMKKLNKICEKVILIDHHKTARERLGHLDNCIIDESRSGCVLAWKYLFPDTPIPKLLLHIEDRDLYKWDMLFSKEILNALDTYPYDFNMWYNFNEKISGFQLPEVIKIGSSIEDYKISVTKKIIKNSSIKKVNGYTCYTVNTPILQSFICNYILNNLKCDLAIAYYRVGLLYKCSLRTKGCDIDASKIAKKFGGGGHFNSAGFYTESFEDILSIDFS